MSNHLVPSRVNQACNNVANDDVANNLRYVKIKKGESCFAINCNINYSFTFFCCQELSVSLAKLSQFFLNF